MSGQSDWPWDTELMRVAAHVDDAEVVSATADLPMAELADLRRSWFETVTATASTDVERSRAAIGRLYQVAGHDPPAAVVVARSPFEGQVFTAIERFATGGRSGPLLPDLQPSARETLAFVTALGAPLAVALWREVAVPLYRRLGVVATRFAVPAPASEDPIARCVRRAAWNRLTDAAPNGMRTVARLRFVQAYRTAFAPTLPAPAGRELLTYLSRADRPGVARQWWAMGGPRAFADAGFFAWLEAAALLGARLSERQAAQIEVGRSCLWAWFLGSAAIFADYPAAIDRDALRQLHHAAAPIVSFRDGTGAWAWRGRPLPPSFFAPGWSVRRALREEDIEERRCAAERIGWRRFVRRALLRRVGPAALDPGNPGAELVLYAPPPWRLDRRRLLLCTNGTPLADGRRRTYGLWVPRHVRDALGAAAWTYGLEPAHYARAVRRT